MVRVFESGALGIVTYRYDKQPMLIADALSKNPEC